MTLRATVMDKPTINFASQVRGPAVVRFVMALHGIENFFTELVNSVIAAWQNRSRVSKATFEDSAAKRRALLWATLNLVLVTLLCLGLGGGVIYLIWWAFTIHERLPG
jgi:fatty acid desaturase